MPEEIIPIVREAGDPVLGKSGRKSAGASILQNSREFVKILLSKQTGAGHAVRKNSIVLLKTMPQFTRLAAHMLWAAARVPGFGEDSSHLTGA